MLVTSQQPKLKLYVEFFILRNESWIETETLIKSSSKFKLLEFENRAFQAQSLAKMTFTHSEHRIPILEVAGP